MYPAFIFFFYQLIIPLRIAFLPINNITIIYFFCSRSSNSLFPALKIKFCFFCFVFSFFFFSFLQHEQFADYHALTFLRQRVRPDSTNAINVSKTCSHVEENKTQYDHNEIAEMFPRQYRKRGNVFFFFFFPLLFFFFERGGEVRLQQYIHREVLLYIFSLRVKSCNNCSAQFFVLFFSCQ